MPTLGHELDRMSNAAYEYKQFGIKLANELDLVEKERDIYLNALSKIAHYCYQCEKYAVEMQQTAERAIKDGQLLRAGKNT